MESQFRLEVRSAGRAEVITVRGELDLASAPALEKELERASELGPELLLLDLSELDFMDSTGLSILVKAHQQATDAGREFALVRGPQQVQRLLTLTGVADRLTLIDTPEELLGES